MNKKVAIIDLGTNTFHLLIAEWNGTRYEVTYRDRLAVKIGMGGINEGIITDAGIQRAVDAMRHFKAIIARESAERVFAFGTSALRNARNGKEVAELIRQQSGIEIKIISGDEEAGYIYQGVRKAVDLGSSPSLIVDIGGGSVEFIIADSNQIFWKQSFEIGAQRLLEKFQKHDPILPEEVRELYNFLHDALEPLNIPMKSRHPSTLVGSSGTFDTLSDIHCLRNNIPIVPLASETPLTFQSFTETFDELLAKNRSQRMQIPGMIEMRVDMIVVACCLIKFLRDRFRFEEVKVSTYSLKEGVLASLR